MGRREKGESTPADTHQGPFQATQTCQVGGESLALGKEKRSTSRSRAGQEAEAGAGLKNSAHPSSHRGLLCGGKWSDPHILRGDRRGRKGALSLQDTSSSCALMKHTAVSRRHSALHFQVWKRISWLQKGKSLKLLNLARFSGPNSVCLLLFRVDSVYLVT